MIDKVGFEREYFLLDDKGTIVEPALHGLPFDEFGFLVEIRSEPCTNAIDLLQDLYNKVHMADIQAESEGLHLYNAYRMKISQTFVKDLSLKYKYETLHDLTANIYAGTQASHASGLAKGWATAGLHVHFSRHHICHRVQLPIQLFVSLMDAKFLNIIKSSNRLMGEYEIKPHGFEYRSLPATVSPTDVADFAFSLFKEAHLCE